MASTPFNPRPRSVPPRRRQKEPYSPRPRSVSPYLRRHEEEASSPCQMERSMIHRDSISEAIISYYTTPPEPEDEGGTPLQRFTKGLHHVTAKMQDAAAAAQEKGKEHLRTLEEVPEKLFTIALTKRPRSRRNINHDE